jgi:carbon storage regulator
MLVLSRRVGESIVIGDDVVITVLDVRGDVVRVGVDAPRSVQVRRQELLVELAETNRAAASPGESAVAGLSRLVSGGARPPVPRPRPSASRPPAPRARD